MDSGADANAVSGQSNSPLNFAAGRGHADTVRILLKNNADPNITDVNGTVPLMKAVAKGFTDITVALIKADANVAKSVHGQKALELAKRGNHQDIVKVLENAGATVPPPKSKPPLVHAADRGDYGKVKRLLEQGSDVNATDRNGVTGLMAAARRGDLLFVKAFIDAGAYVNLKADWLGYTALLWAVVENHIDVTKALLASGEI